MAQAQKLRQAMTQMAGRQGSMLSAYVGVNTAIPENQGRYLVRLRDAMDDEGVPEDLQEQVRGPEETIEALQEENRVYHLAAL